VIIASKAGKLVAAMPANSCMPVSSDPPLFAVAIKTGAKTESVIRTSGKFSVNWLNYSDRKVITLLSGENKSSDKLGSLDLAYFQVFDTPVLSRAQAYVICEVESQQKTGDHQLIIAGLCGAMANLDFDENWKFVDYKPILYRGSAFRNPYTRPGGK